MPDDKTQRQYLHKLFSNNSLHLFHRFYRIRFQPFRTVKFTVTIQEEFPQITPSALHISTMRKSLNSVKDRWRTRADW